MLCLPDPPLGTLNKQFPRIRCADVLFVAAVIHPDDILILVRVELVETFHKLKRMVDIS